MEQLFQGLVNGGKVHGSVEVIGCSKISKEELEGSVDKHGVEDVSLIQYEQVFAWELSNPCRYSPPILCVPKPGARIWKNLEYPSSGARALKMLTKARSASDVNGKAFLELALDMRLQLFEKSKRPYWRIQEKDLDFTMKFEFTKDNLDEKKQKAVEAMELRHYISCLEDEAFCVTSSEIRAWLQERGLPKTGSKDALASRMVSFFPEFPPSGPSVLVLCQSSSCCCCFSQRSARWSTTAAKSANVFSVRTWCEEPRRPRAHWAAQEEIKVAGESHQGTDDVQILCAAPSCFGNLAIQ